MDVDSDLAESPTIKRHSGPLHRLRYGHIPEYPVGYTWKSRRDLCRSGVHATMRSGIQGTAKDGARSTVWSGVYEDDNFEYARILAKASRSTSGFARQFGSSNEIIGGQPPERVKNRQQIRDQEWKRGNLALKRSYELNKPVRVILGPMLHSGSGYRYIGLHRITKAGTRKGISGFQVCFFEFERITDPVAPILSLRNAALSAPSDQSLESMSPSPSEQAPVASSSGTQSPGSSRSNAATTSVHREQAPLVISTSSTSPSPPPTGDRIPQAQQKTTKSKPSSTALIPMRRRSNSVLDLAEFIASYHASLATDHKYDLVAIDEEDDDVDMENSDPELYDHQITES
ncbi:PUA-like domain-containing protein [Flammula alnicola]|nr:PUA-like domain-containing protein [Flammula alnicola]